MESQEKFLDAMEKDIMNADIPESERNKLMRNFLHLKDRKVNLMITGATGCGKSSTINALFEKEVAKVGVGVDPETMEITRYDYGNLILWDSPGLGDGKEADNRHAKNIIKKLLEKDENGEALIDLVLVILDGSSRDLGTSYELINSVIIPNLGENKEKRILIAINQADMAMKGRYWNYEENKPEQQLVTFLEEKALSVKKRIKEGTGVEIDPIYYCAGYKEEGMEQKPYNLSKLLYYIIEYTPKEKRLLYVDNINQNTEMWESNDELADYRTGILESFGSSLTECVAGGADIGGEIGSIFGGAGRVAGTVVGGIIGAGVGVVKGIWSTITGGCYITTAVCEEYGRPDNCYELAAFRKFRDGWLLGQPDGAELVRQYYNTAPAIVDLIDKQENRAEIYRGINDQYLAKCLTFIENKEYQRCKETYIQMMEYLFKEQDKWK